MCETRRNLQGAMTSYEESRSHETHPTGGHSSSQQEENTPR